jgi:hypothetical protein
MRGAGRESCLSELSPRLRESELGKNPVTSETPSLPHAPLTPSLSPRWGEREFPAATLNLNLAPMGLVLAKRES